MNRLIETRNEFLSGVVDKRKFIDNMYDIHSILFDYAEYLGNTNISRIEISDNRIIMTFRDSGIRFICAKNDKRIAPIDTLNFSFYEQEELSMQFKLIEDEFNIFDIGGNFGWYAMRMALEKPNTKIFSFEPIPSTFFYLNENIKLNNFENIKTYNFGFSDTDGSFIFYYDPYLSVNASLTNLSDNIEIDNVTCIVKKLDSFILNSNINIDFIKCDVEGAELLVFKGGLDVIRKERPIIFTEMLRKWSAKFNYHPNEIISLFKELGYLCFTTTEGKLNAFEKMDNSTIQTNYFFLHKEKHASKINEFLYK